MKKTLLLCCLAICTITAYAQSQADYDAVVARFQNFYNHQQTDSIFNMLSERSKALMPLDKTASTFQKVNSQLGTLTAYKFSKTKDGLSYYKADFEKSTLSLMLQLDKDNKMETFRFVPYAPDAAIVNANSNFNLKTSTGTIYGTLTMPAGDKKAPVVLLIAGSGPTDRNGNNALGVTAQSYLMIADSLQNAGIACVRYDKRGIGESAGALKDEANYNFDDGVEDATGFVKMLKADPRFSKVIIMGHSEGSLIGMIVAEKEHANGYISIAGIADRADKVMETQVSGQSKELAVQLTAALDSIRNGYTVNNTDPDLAMLLHTSVQPYLRSWMKYEPSEIIKKIKEPVLILQGTTDIQVPVEHAEKLSKANPHATLKIITGMNHILKQSPADRTANVATYSDPKLPLSDGLMPAIDRFIKGVK